MTIQSQLSRINRYLNQLAQSSEFSAVQLELLMLIKQHNPVTLRKLSEIQQVSMPTLSKLVDGLQRKGLIIRALSKEDARQRWIVPTQKGLSLLIQQNQASQIFWDRRLAKLSDSEKHSILAALTLLADQLTIN